MRGPPQQRRCVLRVPVADAREQNTATEYCPSQAGCSERSTVLARVGGPDEAANQVRMVGPPSTARSGSFGLRTFHARRGFPARSSTLVQGTAKIRVLPPLQGEHVGSMVSRSPLSGMNRAERSVLLKRQGERWPLWPY